MEIIAEEGGIFCGGIFVPEALNFLNSGRIIITDEKKVKPVRLIFSHGEGESFNSGGVVMKFVAESECVRHGIRRILDMILRPLSGIAARTQKAVSEVEGLNVKILDTRKTRSGMIEFEKYAVRTGGGYNHRFGRDDGELIKKEDIEIDGGIIRAIDKALKRKSHLASVEIEVEMLDQLDTVLKDKRVKYILLDNMDIETLKEAVRRADYEYGSYVLEASGIGDRTLKSVAATGDHCISKSSLIDGPSLKMKMRLALIKSA